MHSLGPIVHRHHNCYRFVIGLVALCLITVGSPRASSSALSNPPASMVAMSVAPGASPHAAEETTEAITPELILILVLSAIALLVLPLGYFLFGRSPRTTRSLLLVSTDVDTHRLVTSAARHSGYQTVQVYRYEDALEKLRQNATIQMIAIDDSVPQYEVGLLVSTLQRMPAGLRPLILIRDSSELGQTAFAHRAEAVLSRPLTEQAIEGAIRRVGERADLVP